MHIYYGFDMYRMIRYLYDIIPRDHNTITENPIKKSEYM